jgi:hypothetical protein
MRYACKLEKGSKKCTICRIFVENVPLKASRTRRRTLKELHGNRYYVIRLRIHIVQDFHENVNKFKMCWIFVLMISFTEELIPVFIHS